MTTPLRTDGIDISHYQSGVLDLELAKRNGLRFVYHKATEGVTFRDRRYEQRRAEVAKAGLPFGAYHFASPDGGDAVAEAEAFLAYAKPKPGDLLPVLDLEANPGRLTKAQLTTWTGNFVAEVERQLGVKPIIYTPYDLNDNFGCKLWVARYSPTNALPNVPQPWKTDEVAIRQFSNGVVGVPNGLAGVGNVDLNTLPGGVKSLPSLIFDPAPKPQPKPKVAKLRLATINLSADLVVRNPDRAAQIIADAFAKRDVDLLAVTEYGMMYDKRKGYTKTGHQMVKDLGVDIHNGFGKAGQGATPLIARPGLKFRQKYTFPLLPRIFMGEGAGPDWLKAKWLNVGVIQILGRRLCYAPVHGVPSVQKPLRRRLALRFYRKAAEHANKSTLFGLVAIGGDLNVQPGSKLLDAVRKAVGGMRSAQIDGGIKKTHRVGAIDDVLYEEAPDRWKLVKTEVHDTASDHRLFIAEFKVTARS